MSDERRYMHKVVKWWDKHILEFLSGFLLAFLPLYPKWPLFEALPGYIVRVRLEDFVLLGVVAILLFQAVRKKAKIKSAPFFIPVVVYLGIGFLSGLSAIFLTKTVPMETLHVGKLLLHWVRRVQYISLLFVFYNAITSKHSLKRMLLIFSTTALIVGVYGMGQKYLQWPVYTTMNREFSKGWRLVLTEFARVSSTFGGHYDLAAYLVIVLILALVFGLLLKNRLRYLAFGLFALSYAVLLLTASRTSFIAYLASVALVFMLLYRRLGLYKWIVSGVMVGVISLVGLRFFGTMYDRFAHILMLDRVELAMTGFVKDKLQVTWPKPTAGIPLPNNLALVYSDTDTPPTVVASPPPTEPSQLPPDVFEDIPISFPEASLAAIPDTAGTGNEGKPRTYSAAAHTFGLSSAIRFDALWPKALAAFRTNPLLGTGYSTLLKDQVTDFTEAESTDNDYLRTLGETGLLGFLSFYGLIVYAGFISINIMKKASNNLEYGFGVVVLAAIVSLAINALYIDVFVASKVAYTLWAIVGIAFGYHALMKPKST